MPNTHMEIYEHVWNLDEQIERLRSNIVDDTQSIVSMSVDAPIQQEQENKHIK
jgi:hypothetical protein